MNIHVVPVQPSFIQESGLAVFTPVANHEFSIQVMLFDSSVFE
jgi:hypothetical protein